MNIKKYLVALLVCVSITGCAGTGIIIDWGNKTLTIETPKQATTQKKNETEA